MIAFLCWTYFALVFAFFGLCAWAPVMGRRDK